MFYIYIYIYYNYIYIPYIICVYIGVYNNTVSNDIKSWNKTKYDGET